MFEIKLYFGAMDTEGIIIHSPFGERPKIPYGTLRERLDGIDSFTFRLNQSSAVWGKITPITTLIKITDLQHNRTVFEGRVLNPTRRMTAGGMLTEEYICESKLAYLHDSSQVGVTPTETTVRAVLRKSLERHNERVEPYKHFQMGNITVHNHFKELGVLGDPYATTYTVLRNNLLDVYGGYFVVREEHNGTFLDYLQDVGEVRPERIQIRKNLIDMTKDMDLTDMVTRLIPLGAMNDEGVRMTIGLVNNGLDYIDNHLLQEQFGIIEKTVLLEHARHPRDLMSLAEQELANRDIAITSIDVSAVDLSVINMDFHTFNLGDKYFIDNEYVTSQEPWQIIEKTTNINSPQDSRLVFGKKHQTLTRYQILLNRRNWNIDVVQRQIGTMQNQVININNALEGNTEDWSGKIAALNNLLQMLNSQVDSLMPLPFRVDVHDLRISAIESQLPIASREWVEEQIALISQCKCEPFELPQGLNLTPITLDPNQDLNLLFEVGHYIRATTSSPTINAPEGVSTGFSLEVIQLAGGRRQQKMILGSLPTAIPRVYARVGIMPDVWGEWTLLSGGGNGSGCECDENIGNCTCDMFAFNRIFIGDPNNLAVVNEHVPASRLNDTNTFTRHYGQNWISRGDWVTVTCSHVYVGQFNVPNFRVGDSYQVKATCFREGEDFTEGILIFRYYYDNGSWENAGTVRFPMSTEPTDIEATLTVTQGVDPNRTLRHMMIFFEKGNHAIGLIHFRDVSIIRT